ncbi:MAG: hypothetical protein J6K18_06285 [Bacilli bacterium]|nr:hypothetical protein [Bacilli bacterium]
MKQKECSNLKKKLKVIITNPPSKKEAKEIITKISKTISESLSDNIN